MSDIYAFLGGMVTIGFIVAALFFLRFWTRTRDGLFLAFAVAFFLLGMNQALVSLTDMPIEERSPLYLLRLAAFSLIISSIWRKNRELRSRDWPHRELWLEPSLVLYDESGAGAMHR